MFETSRASDIIDRTRNGTLKKKQNFLYDLGTAAQKAHRVSRESHNPAFRIQGQCSMKCSIDSIYVGKPFSFRCIRLFMYRQLHSVLCVIMTETSDTYSLIILCFICSLHASNVHNIILHWHFSYDMLCYTSRLSISLT